MRGKIFKTMGFCITLPLFILDFLTLSRGKWKLLNLLCAEYPAILLGCIVLIIVYLDDKLDEKTKESGFICLLTGALGGLVLVDLLAYAYLLLSLGNHYTPYSKIIYFVIVLVLGFFILMILAALGFEHLPYIVIICVFLLIPGGITLNETFCKFQVQQYEAKVVRKETYDGFRGSHHFYVFFKGKEKLPVTNYVCWNWDEYDEFTKGENVIIEKYTGILGLPAVEIKHEE